MNGVVALTTSVLDSEVVTFVVNGAKEILGVMTTPPLGTFLTIGIMGAVAGLVGTVVHLVRH